MLIGDRGLRPAGRKFAFSWDLGEEWNRWTGLPFVFALWVARAGVEADGLAQALAAARDEGLTQLARDRPAGGPGGRSARGRVSELPAGPLGVPPRTAAATGDGIVFRVGPGGTDWRQIRPLSIRERVRVRAAASRVQPSP